MEKKKERKKEKEKKKIFLQTRLIFKQDKQNINK